MESKKAKILVTDDDDGMRRIIKFHLAKAGYEVHCAENGKKALEFLKTQKPDLIVSDISMPEMNGYELYKEVSLKKDCRFIPFLFLSSKSDREDIILAKKMGVDDYLTKPLDKDLLLISVEAKLARFMELKDTNIKVLEQKVADIYRTLSHEINTPISIIQGFADLSEMLLNAGKPKIEDLKNFLDGIKSGNDRLKKLAEKVLILNSIDSGYEKERYILLSGRDFVELAQTITSVAIQFSGAIKEKKVEFKLNLIKGPLYIKAVDGHITCIIENLIDNAIKFVKQQTGLITVNCYRDGSCIKLDVIDNGLGIPPEEINKIFDRYYQYNRKSTEQQGLGIGLSIVKSLGEINNLDINVQSEPGKGSTFSVIFKDIKEL